jgi:hypothetical protein
MIRAPCGHDSSRYYYYLLVNAVFPTSFAADLLACFLHYYFYHFVFYALLYPVISTSFAADVLAWLV